MGCVPNGTIKATGIISIAKTIANMPLSMYDFNVISAYPRTPTEFYFAIYSIFCHLLNLPYNLIYPGSKGAVIFSSGTSVLVSVSSKTLVDI